MARSPSRSSTRAPGRPRNDPSAGGKRSAMGLEEDPSQPYLSQPAAGAGDLPGEAEAPETARLGEGLARSVPVIADAVKTLSTSPGFSRMLTPQLDALHAGKAPTLTPPVPHSPQPSAPPRPPPPLVRAPEVPGAVA